MGRMSRRVGPGLRSRPRRPLRSDWTPGRRATPWLAMCSQIASRAPNVASNSRAARSRTSASVASGSCRRAVATASVRSVVTLPPRIAVEPAWTWVRGSDEREPSGELDRTDRPRDDHPSILERLAQPFDRIAAELREFIEEQDAMERQRSRMYTDASLFTGDHGNSCCEHVSDADRDVLRPRSMPVCACTQGGLRELDRLAVDLA